MPSPLLNVDKTKGLPFAARRFFLRSSPSTSSSSTIYWLNFRILLDKQRSNFFLLLFTSIISVHLFWSLLDWNGRNLNTSDGISNLDVYIHTYIHTYTCMCAHARMHVHALVYVCMYAMLMCIRMGIYVRKYAVLNYS